MIYNLCLPKKITKKKIKRNTANKHHTEITKEKRLNLFSIWKYSRHLAQLLTLSSRELCFLQFEIPVNIIYSTYCILVNWCSVLMKTDVLIKLKGGRSRNMKQNIVVNLRVTTYPTYCLHVIFMWPPFSSSLLTFILLCNSNILLVDCPVNYCFIGACTIQVCSNFPRAICM